MNFVDRIAQFVYPPEHENESDEKRLNRAILVVMASATSMGGLVWGTVYWALGVSEVSVWPYGYVVLSFLNLMIYLRTKQYNVLLIGQLLFILLVPTFLMWHLGGFAASGAVILWSFLSPIVALVVSEERKQARIWFVAFFTLVFISGVIETRLAEQAVVRMPNYGVNMFFVMNVFAPLITSYLIVFYFIGEGRRATNAMLKQAGELATANSALQQLTESLEEKVRIRTKELHDALSHLSAVINSLVDGLLVTDMEGNVTNFNPTVVKMFNLDGTELKGKKANSIFNEEMVNIIDNARSDHDGAFSTEVQLPGERIGNAASTAIVLSASSENGTSTEIPQQASDGAIGTVTLIRDVTREKEVDRMKTDFISTVSHELRTPLTSVLGFARIIQKRFDEVLLPVVGDVDDRKVKRAIDQITSNVNIIVSEGERLTALINDVLDIAKMEAGKTEWHMKDTSMSHIIDRAVAATSGLFTEKNDVQFIKEVDENLPIINVDEDRLIQVLVNLISNASKFTETGAVTVRAEVKDEVVLVSVRDTGIGIPFDNIESVFDRFTQVGNTLTDKPQGTGLGLPICKQIIEHHKGRIWAESELNKGTTFLFTIPMAADAVNTEEARQQMLEDLVKQLRKKAASASADLRAARAGLKRILVVDDETNIRMLLRQVLEAEGYEVAEARDGVEAINQVKKSPPDLIILDIMMPNVNGFDVATILKSDTDTMRIPIIVLSIVEDRERGIRLGVDRYLSKPLDTRMLLQEIEEVLEEGSHPRTVLVMDEDATVVRSISDVLAAKGYKVVEASNNNELVNKALTTKPDMIVLSSVSEEQSDIVHTLRFERGLENIYIVQYK